MANVKESVNVELENISTVFIELKKIKDKPNKTIVELAGIGAFLHNIYTGIENVLKQILKFKGISIPISNSWHRDLLMLASDKEIITEDTKKKLADYLAFRHFFVHAYGFLLDEQELKRLVDNIFETYSIFKEEIDAYLSKEEHRA
ncbi:TPA: hypothetical protein DCX16_04790 [bacterium]|nr:hypothetical protein [bacterium]